MPMELVTRKVSKVQIDAPYYTTQEYVAPALGAVVSVTNFNVIGSLSHE